MECFSRIAYKYLCLTGKLKSLTLLARCCLYKPEEVNSEH
ncbi:hypothetical protein JM656_05160 [Citrobacter sp. R56]|nr:hypothetical protein JM656_05160 [Citrobacter sp. R56]